MERSQRGCKCSTDAMFLFASIQDTSSWALRSRTQQMPSEEETLSFGLVCDLSISPVLCAALLVRVLARHAVIFVGLDLAVFVQTDEYTRRKLMAEPDIPHFTYPFRLEAGHFATTEQDSLDDITSCVTTICLTPDGWFPELPEFGLPDLTFSHQPVGSSALEEIIVRQEPRARTLIEEDRDAIDTLATHIRVNVHRRGR